MNKITNRQFATAIAALKNLTTAKAFKMYKNHDRFVEKSSGYYELEPGEDEFLGILSAAEIYQEIKIDWWAVPHFLENVQVEIGKPFYIVDFDCFLAKGATHLWYPNKVLKQHLLVYMNYMLQRTREKEPMVDIIPAYSTLHPLRRLFLKLWHKI